jgi:hypothetical protein
VAPSLNVGHYGWLDLSRAYGGPIAGVQVPGTLHLDNREEQDEELRFGHTQFFPNRKTQASPVPVKKVEKRH